MELELHSDCSKCAALCCVAFSFDSRASFGIDKEAEEPCPNLDECGGCKIYGRREEEGFIGCLTYDCHGAGQRVTQEMFGGQSWLSDTALLKPMCEAMAVMRRLHEVLAMAQSAKTLPIDDSDQKALAALLEEGTFDSSQMAFEDLYFRVMDLETRTRSLLKSFSKYGAGLNG
ncbi:MAG: hypothetical protein HWE23_12850 [Rhodobacteraceae bacterium]|nr:hypothetical protein [Paracoccaceae bacterium]